MQASKTHDDFADETPVDWPSVIAEARQFRERNSALDSWTCALQRDRALRLRKAFDAYAASISPLERERRCLETELGLLRAKLIGAHRYDRERYASRMVGYSTRLSEIAALQSQREAA